MKFIHEPLNKEVTAMGGHYLFVDEKRFEIEGRSVLYRIGHALLDSSCCGMTGCGYALVAGFVINWKVRRKPDGVEVSEIEPVVDADLRKRVREMILSHEPVTQVVFL